VSVKREGGVVRDGLPFDAGHPGRPCIPWEAADRNPVDSRDEVCATRLTCLSRERPVALVRAGAAFTR
jgi:hypothetical protein